MPRCFKSSYGPSYLQTRHKGHHLAIPNMSIKGETWGHKNLDMIAVTLKNEIDMCKYIYIWCLQICICYAHTYIHVSICKIFVYIYIFISYTYTHIFNTFNDICIYYIVSLAQKWYPKWKSLLFRILGLEDIWHGDFFLYPTDRTVVGWFFVGIPGVLFFLAKSRNKYMGVSKNRGKTPKMDGENNGNPY